MYILIKRTTYVTNKDDVLESTTRAYYTNAKREAVKKLIDDYNKLIKYIDKRSSLYKMGEDNAISKQYAWLSESAGKAEMCFREMSRIRGDKYDPAYWATKVSYEIVKGREI